MLTLALRGRLKVGLDIEQACQGVVTHTRSTRQMQQPATPLLLGSSLGGPVHPVSTPVALCEPKGVLNSQTRADSGVPFFHLDGSSAQMVQLSCRRRG